MKGIQNRFTVATAQRRYPASTPPSPAGRCSIPTGLFFHPLILAATLALIVSLLALWLCWFLSRQVLELPVREVLAFEQVAGPDRRECSGLHDGREFYDCIARPVR